MNPVKNWYTASELAALQLPGLPRTESATIRRAKRESWKRQDRVGKGGGAEYHLSGLPKEARAALLDRAVDDGPDLETLPAVASTAQVPATATTAPLADWQRRCADARAAILAETLRLATVSGVNAAIMKMVDRAAAGELRPELQALVPLANARGGKAGKRTLSRRTLYRWLKDAEAGTNALAPREAASPAPVPPWAPALLKLYRTPTKRSLAAVMEDLPKQLPEGIPCPSYDQARRFLKRVSVVERERGRHGPNGLLKFKGFKRRSTDGFEPLDIVTADGHTFKADVAHPVHGRPFRPEVCAIMDTVTRYVFGWSAGLAESTWVVMDTIRHGVSSLGMFALFYTDNGSGFVSDALTDEVLGFLGRVGGTPTNSIPGRAQARGKVERVQQSLWKRGARELITYSGRDMDNEARLRVKKLVAKDIKEAGASRLVMSWQEFLDWAQKLVDSYNSRPHRELPKTRDPETGKLRHMSPAEYLADWRARGWEPMTLPEGSEDDLFRPYEFRTANRGEINLPWGRYFHQDLVHLGREKVRVGYDIHDGSKIWVRSDRDGRLICIAERDANVIPEQPVSKAEHAKKQRADARMRLLQQHAEEVEAERGPGLLEHQPAMPFGLDLETQQRIEAEFEARMAAPKDDAPTIAAPPAAPTVTAIPQAPEDRYAFWVAIDARITAGEAVSDQEALWHERYQAHSDFKGFHHLATVLGASPRTATS